MGTEKREGGVFEQLVFENRPLGAVCVCMCVCVCACVCVCVCACVCVHVSVRLL